MNVVLQWLAQQSYLLYLVCLIGAIGYGAAALAARRQQEAAQFLLERELTKHRMGRAWVMAGLFVGLGVLIFAVSRYVTPNIPPVTLEPPTSEVGITPQPTATSTAEPTATPTLTSITLEAEATPGEINITPGVSTPTPTPTPTPEPTPLPPAPPPNCPSPDVQISAPVAGGAVGGIIEVRGTATINAFAYYKFEVEFPGSTTPNFISQFATPVENGILGYWDVSNRGSYPNGGPYSLRLVAVDIYGNTTNCIIPVYIQQ